MLEIGPHYTIPVSWHQTEELKELYNLAVNRLSAESVLGWLETQPSYRVVSQPGQALGCLLATYLMTVTTQLWFIGETTFWHFSLSARFAWTLPEWAVHLVRLERHAAQPLTAGECIVLVQRAQRQPPLGLTIEREEAQLMNDASDDHVSIEGIA